MLARPEEISKARSAASGVGNTYVELRNTAGRAEPTDRVGSKPCVRTLVFGLNARDSRRSVGLLGLIAESPHHLYSTEVREFREGRGARDEGPITGGSQESVIGFWEAENGNWK